MNKANYVNSDIVKYATVSEAMQRYRLSRSLLMKVANDNKALRKIGRAVRVDIKILDEAMELYDY